MKRAWESAEILLGINFEAMNPNDGWVNPDFSSDSQVYKRDVFGRELLALYLKITEIESRIETCSETESWLVRRYYECMDCNDYDRIREWVYEKRKNHGFGLRIIHKHKPDLFGIPW